MANRTEKAIQVFSCSRAEEIRGKDVLSVLCLSVLLLLIVLTHQTRQSRSVGQSLTRVYYFLLCNAGGVVS